MPLASIDSMVAAPRSRSALGCAIWLSLLTACSNTPAATGDDSTLASTGSAPGVVASGAGGSTAAKAVGTASAVAGRPATATTTGSGTADGTKAAASAAAGSGSAPMAKSGAAGSPTTQGAAGSRAAVSGAAGGSAAAGAAGMSAAMAGVAGQAGKLAEGGADGAGKKPGCLKKQSQVVVVGDSYLNWLTHAFPEDFKKEFGAEYRMYAVGGASMASGGIAGFIPDQFEMAVADDPDILATVMTGGGNDILIADTTKYPGSDACKDSTDAPMQKVCQDVIAEAMKVAGELMQKAAEAGVQDVAYLYYPKIPGGGFGGMNPNFILAYSLPLARELCEGAIDRTGGKLRCHFLDLQPIFEGHADWFADDGIHENEKGSAAMAKAVVQLFKDKCIAQPAESGCCAP